MWRTEEAAAVLELEDALCGGAGEWLCIISGELRRAHSVPPWHLLERRDCASSQVSKENREGPCACVPSRMSTTRQSPGSAPSTAIGPERLWIFVRSTFLMSSLSAGHTKYNKKSQRWAGICDAGDTDCRCCRSGRRSSLCIDGQRA